MLTNTLNINNYISKYKPHRKILRSKNSYYSAFREKTEVQVDKKHLTQCEQQNKQKLICTKVNIFDQSQLNKTCFDLHNKFQTLQDRRDLKFFGSRELTQISGFPINKIESKKYYATISTKQKVIYLRPKSSKSVYEKFDKPMLTQRVNQLNITRKKLDSRPTSACSLPKTNIKLQQPKVQQKKCQKKENVTKPSKINLKNIQIMKSRKRQSLLSPW